MDPELDAIRAQRMAQMQMGGGAGGPTPEQQAEEEERKAAMEERRRAMLTSVMTNEARERLSRVALVKPEKAKGVENMILAAAQRGAITERISDDRLCAMLESISEREGKGPKITIQRRRPVFDDDD